MTISRDGRSRPPVRHLDIVVVSVLADAWVRVTAGLEARWAEIR